MKKGLVFFFKYFIKKFFKTLTQPYSGKEIFYASIGKLGKVNRVDTSHKGFDYDMLIKQLSQYFDIIEVKGIPFGFLPPSLNFTIGIIVKRKERLQ